MADPTIQTFCCHPANGTDVALAIMDEFNTDTYNIVCIFSSALGILGAVYQILPREQFSNNHRWLSFSALRGRRIIIWLAVADLLASLGVFTRSTLWINYKNIMPAIDDGTSVLFCAVSSAFTQYFYTATWIWTLCYAVDMRLVLRQKDSQMKFYHIAAWIIPAILTVTGLSLLYVPDANCHYESSLSHAILRILPNYLATYVPITVVMIANPLLYRHSTEDLQAIITSTTGQFTSRERDLMDAVKIKFAVINVVFYICWVPNLINGILLWTLWFHLPVTWIISIWYIMMLAAGYWIMSWEWYVIQERRRICRLYPPTFPTTDYSRLMRYCVTYTTILLNTDFAFMISKMKWLCVIIIIAFMNPLQALCNCLVYRRWSSGSERVILPWRHLGKDGRSETVSTESFTEQTIREEIYPLLQSTPLNSVNMYRSISSTT